MSAHSKAHLFPFINIPTVITLLQGEGIRFLYADGNIYNLSSFEHVSALIPQ